MKGSFWKLYNLLRVQCTFIWCQYSNELFCSVLSVTSSEKVDKEKRYADFTLISLPYPGCEFFKEFRENDYCAKGLVFDWSQTYVDAQIGIPEDSISCQYLSDSSSGMLIHCISGWDRTPLYISLLRISLWADGAIHTSLDAYQILYYTIAYDWMLFGHDLQDRLNFSINRHNRSKHPVLRNDSDSQLDNVMFDNESIVTLSSVSSNLSLNSWCSSVSQNSRDSQDNNPPAVFQCASGDNSQEDYHSNGNVVQFAFYHSPNKEAHGSRSPLPPNRTSPVAVPVPGRLRQRNESSSSGGSWQMISGTGSLRGSTTANAPIADALTSSNLACRNLCETFGHTSQESSTTIIEDEACSSSPVQTRKDRLQCLRTIFYSAYKHTGFRMKDNSEPGGLGQIIGNFAEKKNQIKYLYIIVYVDNVLLYEVRFIKYTILWGGTFSLQKGHCGLLRNQLLMQGQQNV
ncbi:myotubularin-related protein 14 [Vespula squamosa]|uniref:Myotubularin-related protein 14 n=1 Tax=Vespula squamosa TaxID=30214 RepID=A0ABD2AQC3_VESSQ